jgi:chemotaxis protein histidine kinase CheA
MTADPFLDRIARVRERFATSLAGKIDETCAAIPHLWDVAPSAAATAAEAYRCMHGIVGVGPSVGFPGCGNAAHEVEAVLKPPKQERRGLTAEEIARLTSALQALREVAARELESFQPVQS